MTTVWRVDDHLLTLVEVEYNERMPIGVWLPAMVGQGSYAYFEQYDEAKDTLVDILNEEIEALETLRTSLEEKENE